MDGEQKKAGLHLQTSSTQYVGQLSTDNRPFARATRKNTATFR